MKIWLLTAARFIADIYTIILWCMYMHMLHYWEYKYKKIISITWKNLNYLRKYNSVSITRTENCRRKRKVQSWISIDLLLFVLCLLPTWSISLPWEGHTETEEPAENLLCLHFSGNLSSFTCNERCSVNEHSFNIGFYSQFLLSTPMLYFNSLNSCHSLRTQILISSWFSLWHFSLYCVSATENNHCHILWNER